jgi:hypothetical protein
VLGKISRIKLKLDEIYISLGFMNLENLKDHNNLSDINICILRLNEILNEFYLLRSLISDSEYDPDADTKKITRP